MTDKQEYLEGAATGSNHSSSVSGTIAENLRHEMEHETKEQAALDIEMAKARKTSQEPASRRWIVLATATLGALFVSLQGSALVVALPDLMQNLNVRGHLRYIHTFFTRLIHCAFPPPTQSIVPALLSLVSTCSHLTFAVLLGVD